MDENKTGLKITLYAVYVDTRELLGTDLGMCVS